jgi:general secretion pathway protein K
VNTAGSNQKGIALIIVILMLSIIVALTLQFNRTSRSAVYDSVNMSDGIRLRYVAKSGFNAAQALLMINKDNYDTLTQDWAKTEELSAQSEGYFNSGAFRVIIEDESGKISVNKLVTGAAVNPAVKEMLVRLLSLPEFHIETERIQTIIDSLKDWIDTDNEVTGSGAESDYYKSLDKPYTAKNGPLDNLEELLMVKGMSEDLYYGTQETPGLGKYLTIYGDGKININTCPKLLFRVLAKEITPEMADEMDRYRRNPDNYSSLSDPMWYKKIPSMVNISINSGWIMTRSDYFQIFSTGYFQNMSETVSGAIKRDQTKKTAKLLSWKVY